MLFIFGNDQPCTGGIAQIKIHNPNSTSPILHQAASCPLPLLLTLLLHPLLARLLPLLLVQLLPAPLLASLGNNYLIAAGNRGLHCLCIALFWQS